MSEWTTYRFGDVTTNFDARRVPLRAPDRTKGPYPYYGASGVIDYVEGYLFDGEFLLVAEDGENLRTRKTPIAFLADGQFWVNNHAHIVKANSLANTRYLSYLISEVDVSGYLSGSTQPKLTQAAMNLIRIRLPPKKYQDGVVEVLRALDDKIAVDNRIAAVAEQLSVSLVSRGSSTVPLAELVESVRDQVEPLALDVNAVAYFSIPAFDESGLPETIHPHEIRSGKLRVTRSAVLVSKLNPASPRAWLVDPAPELPAVASTEFLVLRPRPETGAGEIWAACSQPEFWDELVGKTTGTSNSHQRVRLDDLLVTPVVDPRALPSGVRGQLSVLGSRATRARLEARTLAELRDTLLAGLMSGAIRVREAEAIVSDGT